MMNKTLNIDYSNVKSIGTYWIEYCKDIPVENIKQYECEFIKNQNEIMKTIISIESLKRCMRYYDDEKPIQYIEFDNIKIYLQIESSGSPKGELCRKQTFEIDEKSESKKSKTKSLNELVNVKINQLKKYINDKINLEFDIEKYIDIIKSFLSDISTRKNKVEIIQNKDFKFTEEINRLENKIYKLKKPYAIAIALNWRKNI